MATALTVAGLPKPAPDLSHPTYGTWFNPAHAQAVRLAADVTRPFPLLDSIDLAIFDLDGTLARPREGTRGEHQGFPITPDDRELIPGTLQMCGALLDRGIPIAIATNQGGVAIRKGTPDSVMAVVYAIAKEIGASAAIASWSHPKATIPELRIGYDEMRKPQPGMLHWLLRAFGVLPYRAVYIGDSQEDYAAACNVTGMQYWEISPFRASVLRIIGYTPEPDPDREPDAWLQWMETQKLGKVPA